MWIGGPGAARWRPDVGGFPASQFTLSAPHQPFDNSGQGAGELPVRAAFDRRE
jgi:hypothetical protein